MNKKSYKDVDIYYIGYITLKQHLNIHIVNPLYLLVNEVDGHNDHKIGYRYLITASTDKNKETLIKYTKAWDKIDYLIKKTNCGEAGDY